MADVAVILPVFNAADTVARCLESLCNQTYRNLSIMAVDDGSTDASAEILAEWARRDQRIMVLRHRCNRGICAALSTGLAAVRGERYIARMDADDWSHPARLQRQIDFLERHSDIGMAGTLVRFGGDRTAQRGYAAYVDWTNSLITPEEIALNRFVESPFAHPSVMFRSDLISRCGGYQDGPFPEDYELWLRWMDQGIRMGKVPERLLIWHDPPDRLSRTDSRYARRAFYACKARYLARWLAAHNPLAPEVIVWGAGRETRKRAECLVSHGVVITHYIDIDPRKIGQCIHGRPVLDPEHVPEPGGCFVVSYVGSRGARDDIRRRLSRRGYQEGVNFIVAA